MFKAIVLAAMLGPAATLVQPPQSASPPGPSEYVVPATSCYTITDFAIDTIDDAQAVRLAGSFLAPAGGGARPTILMITGSGGHVRQQMISGVPMFGLLADVLARAGFNVVMTDARGFGGSTIDGEVLPEPGWLKIATPARYRDNQEIINHLMTRPDVEKEGLILLGHSEGSMIAGRLAADRTDIALSVLLSDSTAPGNELFADQRTQAAIRNGASPEVAAAIRVQLLAMARQFAIDADDAAAFEEISEGFAQVQQGLERPIYGPDFVSFHREAPFLIHLMTYDPYADISRIQSPVLAIWGGDDDATPAHVHAPILARALGEADNDDIGLRIIPDQDHFFLEHEGVRVARHPYGKVRIANELEDLLLDELGRRFPGVTQAYCHG